MMKVYFSFKKYFFMCFVATILLGSSVSAEKITVIHTAALNSSVCPSNYLKKEDKDRGGIAAVITVIENERKKKGGSLLILDSGGFIEGSLGHTLTGSKRSFYRLMFESGYNGINLSVSPFLMESSFLQNLKNKQMQNKSSPLLTSGIICLNRNDNLALKNAFQNGIVFRVKKIPAGQSNVYVLGVPRKSNVGYLEKKGLLFENIITTLNSMITEIRSTDANCVVVLLSEGRTTTDQRILKEVQGIDLLLGTWQQNGVSFARYYGTPVFRPRPYGTSLWRIVLGVNKGNVSVTEKVEIDLRKIKQHTKGKNYLAGMKQEIDKRFLEPAGMTCSSPIAERNFYFKTASSENSFFELFNDSLVSAYKKSGQKLLNQDVIPAVSFASSFFVNAFPETRGFLYPEDIFIRIPESISGDGNHEDYLCMFNLSTEEIKLLLELTAGIPGFKTGSMPYFSGLKAHCNYARVPFDRITKIELQKNDGTLHEIYPGTRLKEYTFIGTSHSLEMIKKINDHHSGLFKLKAENITGIISRGSARLNSFYCIVEYISSFKDLNKDGIPDIPAKYGDVKGFLDKNRDVGIAALFSNPSVTVRKIYRLLLMVLLIFVVFYKTFSFYAKQHGEG